MLNAAGNGVSQHYVQGVAFTKSPNNDDHGIKAICDGAPLFVGCPCRQTFLKSKGKAKPIAE